ncbi:MAG: hypothetical protein O3B08_18265 [Proteobacteria bacterium]|nr:hypothetical protein [Pseudomonadota bacterium]
MRRRKWLIAAAALLSFGLAGLVLLPFAIQYGLIAAIEAPEKGRTATISDVDYNPFTGRLTIRDLTLQGAEGRGATVQRLFVEIENRAIWRKRIYLRQVSIDGAALDIDLDGPLRIAGFALPAGTDSAETDSGWRSGIDHLEISDSKINLHANGNVETLAIDAGNGKPFLMWAEDSAGDITADFVLPGGKLHIDGTAMPFQPQPGFDFSLQSEGIKLGPILALLPQGGLPALDATLATELRFRTDGGDTLRVSGALKADGIRLTLPDRPAGPLTLTAMALNDIDAAITFRPTLAVKLTGAMNANGLRANLPGHDRPLTAGTLSLKATDTTLGFGDDGRFSLRGGIALTAGALTAPLQPGGSARADLAWNGALAIQTADATPSITADGALQLDDVSIETLATGMTLSGAKAGFKDRAVFGPGQGGDTLDLKGAVETGALAYSAQDMTVKIVSAASPAVDLQVTLAADGGMDMKATGTLDGQQVTVRQADPDGAELAIGQFALDDIVAALTLLRDSNDMIRLSVPVQGDITNPQFDFSNAVNQAIGGAIKSTMTTLLKVAFPIGGLILTVVDSAGNTQLMIEPVPFAAGESALLPAAATHLDNVAKLLGERPQVRLTICAQVTEPDRAALLARMQEEAARKAAEKKAAPTAPAAAPAPVEQITVLESDLLALARQRNEAVKDDLIARHKIDESRLFLCAAGSVAGTDSEQPRVDLRF